MPIPRLTASAERRCLFLYSPVGGGHRAASRAVAAAWRARHPDWRADEIDTLAFLPAWERRLWTGLYGLTLRHWPSLWRSYRRFTNRPGEPRLFRDRVKDLGAGRFAAVLRQARPRLVVSTSGGAAALAGAARARLGQSFVNALVVAGFRAHRHWARPEADLLFVSSDPVKADLVARGIPPQRVFVVGLPVRAGLRPLAAEEKAALRTRLGLGDDPVLVIASGGTGAYRALPVLLRALERLGRRMDVVTFAGPAAPPERRDRMRLFRLGFREDFCDWLAASDLGVGKLGGMTAAEACAVGVPLVVYEPIPGQEEENASHLVAAGAALWPRNRPALEHTVAGLLDDTAGQRQRMALAARALARPDAASDIEALLAAAVGERP